MMSRTANWGRFARAAGGLEARLLRAFALSILSLLLLGGCNTGRSASTPDSALAASADALAPTLVSTDTAQPVVALFVTPVPVRAEEPLAGASRNVPSIFEGVAAYAPVPAVLTAADALEWSAPTIAEAARAVVQIRRCDVFGCTTPVGSGVIIHTNGLVLTAFHVLLVDPNDPNSDRHSDLVIATTENTRSAPQPRYRARLIASKPDQDLALLAIDRDAGTNQPVDVRELQLPTLPLADVATLFGDELHVLGFPTSGGEAISYDRINFRSFDDNGRVIVVNQPLDRGNSGGPALVVRDGHFAIAGLVIRRRSTQGQLSQEGLLRAIDQLHSLTWTPNVMRAWAENVQAIQSSNETNALQFSLILNTLDLVDTPLRLLFYATDAATGQPWQPASAGAPLVVWADVTLQQVFARQTLTLTVPVDALGAPPERLRFHPLLWDVGQGAHRWEALADGVQPAPVAVAMATTASSTDTPAAVDTATSLPAETTILTTTAIQTDTPTPADTPTLDLVATQTAEAQNLATAVAATLAARFTSTPTPSATLNFEQRLATAVAATLAAQATVTSTPTTTLAPPTNTATATPTPTVTRRPTVTDTPESTSTPMTPLANYPLQPYGPGWPMVGGNSANTSWNVRESKLKPPFRELWHWDVDGIFFSEELTYYAGVVYVTGSQRQEGRVGQEIYAIEIGASEPLWSQHLEEGEASVGHGVAIAGDKVFFGSQSNDSLFLADARSGEILQVYTGFTSLYERHVKVADGVAYAASAVVRAIRASNGEVLWRVDLGDVRGNNAVVNDLYVTGSDQNNQGGMAMELVALHTADGAIVWRTPSLRGHTVMSDGESVYTVASSTNDQENMDSVVAYNSQTGDEVWRQELNYPIGFWAKGALGDGRLFFEGGPRDGDDRRIYAFDSLSGQLIDIIVYPGDHWIYDMAIANGLLYVGTRYQLDVYDTDSLAKVWSGFGTVNQIAIADGMLLVLAGSTVYAYVPE